MISSELLENLLTKNLIIAPRLRFLFFPVYLMLFLMIMVLFCFSEVLNFRALEFLRVDVDWWRKKLRLS